MMEKLRHWFRVWRARRELQPTARGKALDLLASSYGIERGRRWLVFKESDESVRHRVLGCIRG